MKSILSTFFSKNKYLVSFILIVTIFALGGGYFHYNKRQTELKTQTAEANDLQKNLMNALQNSKNEKDFRQAISDLAWGRHRQQPKAKNEKIESQATGETGEMGLSYEQMQMLQSRMEYCLKNAQKDPSCGYRAQVPANTSVK